MFSARIQGEAGSRFDHDFEPQVLASLADRPDFLRGRIPGVEVPHIGGDGHDFVTVVGQEGKGILEPMGGEAVRIVPQPKTQVQDPPFERVPAKARENLDLALLISAVAVELDAKSVAKASNKSKQVSSWPRASLVSARK